MTKSNGNKPVPGGSGGVASGLQPGGTAPGGQPGATRGSIGTGGASTAGEPSGNVAKRERRSREPDGEEG